MTFGSNGAGPARSEMTFIGDRRDLRSAEVIVLAEYQHRVANDLGVALGALAQARRQVVGQAASSIDEAAERIGELVRLQRLLAPPTRRSTVDLRERIVAVCDGLAGGHLFGSGTVINRFVDPLAVDARTAWMVAVIVAELVTNAAKHAHPLGGGRILVEVEGPIEGLTIRVTDDGRTALGPHPALAAPTWSPGQGTGILAAIVEGVGGHLTTTSGAEGTVVEVNVGTAGGRRTLGCRFGSGQPSS